MKILYISGMYPRPDKLQYGIFCHQQVKALREKGIELDVIVPIVIYNRTIATTEWEYEGVSVRYVHYFKFPGTFFLELSGLFLYNSLLRLDIDYSVYDIFHAGDSPLPTGDALLRLGVKYNKPVVQQLHGLDVYFDVAYAGRPGYKRIARRCEKVFRHSGAVICVSQKVLDNVEKRVDAAKKGYVVYNGVDVDRFTPKEYRDSNNDDVLHVVAVGNLIPIKGHDDAIDAVYECIEEGYTNVRLTIIGSGKEERNLKDKVSSLGLSKYVCFPGDVSYDEVAYYMRHSDVFLLPSWHEALGCVYLEAMACGLPAIGCRDNGIEEVINDGENGFLVNSHSPHEICRVLLRLRDKSLRKSVGAKARETVVEKYTWEASAISMIECYGSIGVVRG